RNLVVCIDGTSNQFGEKNTNVVALYNQIVKSDEQLTYYNSGIGTYAKSSWKSLKYIGQVLDNKIDLAIAWNFERIVKSAYRWLTDNYRENDKIYLFGFSRGAYQVRVLAGMMYRVGLIHKGNEEQIPFAYELYAKHDDTLSLNFKKTFSREVKVEFVGLWDTVSSVGIVRGKSLPQTESADHIRFFRHALALDERRVKFLPEYVSGNKSIGQADGQPRRADGQPRQPDKQPDPPHIKEVWFPGTHSDISTPLLWMSFEAVICGLKLNPSTVAWKMESLNEVKESLTGIWVLFEWIPWKRFSYNEAKGTTHR
ncbi:hypothetical protein M422DRAFT_121683, partial [Sphaerobolus stellatus SS14]